jgi:hypothetical protein
MAVIVCAFTGNMCPGKKRVDQAFVCEGFKARIGCHDEGVVTCVALTP